MKKIAFPLAILLLILISLTSYTCHSNKRDQGEVLREEENPFELLKQKADSALDFCKKQGFNTDYCYLVDFKIHSGKKRFYIWDFKADTIKCASLCCHGYGKGSTTAVPVFSNVEGSYCSSLGKYKVGERAYSQYGINTHYKLHGLDATNSNAFKRWVVLHSHNPIPEYEIYPQHLPLGYSQGCPVINNEIMKQVDQIQKDAKKPILLWIYK